VFFAMLTLRMIPSSGQVTRLPTSTSAIPLPSPKLLIELTATGRVMVEGRSISFDELGKLASSRTPGRLEVTIAGSEDASMQHLMKAIDALRHAGVTQIGLATRAPEKP
jgi:biopolymer transport protein ExbD